MTLLIYFYSQLEMIDASGFFSIIFGVILISFLLMHHSRRSRSIFTIVLVSLILLNVLHYIGVKSYYTNENNQNLGAAIGYYLGLIVETFVLLLISVVWYFVNRKKRKNES